MTPNTGLLPSGANVLKETAFVRLPAHVLRPALVPPAAGSHAAETESVSQPADSDH
jgi:hypothetical protein